MFVPIRLKACANQSINQINQMFISSNHPLGCSKDKRPFAGPPTTWKADTTFKQVDHNGATQYAVWWNMLIAAGVEKVKRQWLQLKPDQASWAQNSDMELVKPMMVLYMDEGDVVVIAGVVEC